MATTAEWVVVSGAAILPFPAPEIVASYRIAVDPGGYSAEAIAFATTILVNEIQAGRVVPPTTIDRLVVFALYGVGHDDLRHRLTDALAAIRDDRVRLRACLQIEDPVAPADRTDVARRLLRLRGDGGQL